MYKYKIQSTTVKIPQEFVDWETKYYVMVGDIISYDYSSESTKYNVVAVESADDYTILWVL